MKRAYITPSVKIYNIHIAGRILQSSSPQTINNIQIDGSTPLDGSESD